MSHSGNGPDNEREREKDVVDVKNKTLFTVTQNPGPCVMFAPSTHVHSV